MHDELESLIDLYSLTQVLQAIHDICEGKADHLEVSWQDTNAAKTWRRTAKKLDPAIKFADQHGI